MPKKGIEYRDAKSWNFHTHERSPLQDTVHYASLTDYIRID